EHDPYGPIEFRPLEEGFRGEAAIWEVRLAGGVVLRTTAEHPVFVWGRGWVPARELRPGDRLRRGDGGVAGVGGGGCGAPEVGGGVQCTGRGVPYLLRRQGGLGLRRLGA